jgi:hypothetical protein
MAENLDLNINVNTEGAEGSVKSFREQLREATKDVLTLSEKFGATSDEAINAAKKVAELRDKIGDAKALSDAYNPDAKFKALTSSLAGVAGGFGAVQGAMALFGTESENVQKTLLKVQSAMALSQGLQSIGESIDSFKILASVIRTQVVAAFATLRSAIISTGVLALVAGVGYLISKLIEWADSTEDVTKAQDKLNKSLATQDEYLNLAVKELERANKYRTAKLKEQGATEAVIAKENKENQKKILEAYEEDYRVKYAKYQKDLTRIAKIEDEKKKEAAEKSSDDLRKQLIADFEKLKDLRVGIRVDVLNENKRQDDEDLQNLIEKLERETQKIINEETKRAEDLHKIREKLGKQEVLDARKLSAFKQQDKEDLEKQAEDRALKLTQGFWGKRAQAQIEQWDKDAALNKKNKEDLINAEQTFESAKLDIAYNGLELIGQLAGQGTQIAKVAALSQILIGTGVGFINGLDIAQKSAKGTGPAAAFAFPIFYATQIAAVLGAATRAHSILTQVPGGGGGGSISAPTMSQAPISPQLPRAQTTNLSQQSINDIGNQAVRAYVIESDVTSNQQRIAAIRQRARFS